MSNEMSPYDELVLKVNRLEECFINTTQMLNRIVNILKDDEKITRDLFRKINELEKKLSPENPGDINNLYQNWDKH